MWQINIERKNSSDDCKLALQALKPMLKNGSVKYDGQTLDGVQVMAQFGQVTKAVELINSAGYQTDEDGEEE